MKGPPKVICPKLSDSEHRVRLIGELMSLMDSGSATSAVEIDNKIAACFKQYADCTPQTISPDIVHLFLAVHSKAKPVVPPKCLIKSNAASSLERYSKLERVVRSVTIFDKDISIRDFLMEMEAVVTDLNCDISESEFRYIMLNKLSTKIKSILTVAHSTATLPQIYTHLLNLYDNSSSERDVFSTLVSGKQNFSNLKEYLEYTLRLLSNIGSSKESSNAMIHNLKVHLPARVYDHIIDYADKYQALKGKAPPVDKIVGIFYTHSETIDKLFSSKGHSKFNEVKIDTPQHCTVCGKPGHTENSCLNKATCPKCNSSGHTMSYCKLNKPLCQKCGQSGHLTMECRSRCRLCNALAQNAVMCPVYSNIEPAQIHCARCFDSMNLNYSTPHHNAETFLLKKNSY